VIQLLVNAVSDGLINGIASVSQVRDQLDWRMSLEIRLVSTKKFQNAALYKVCSPATQ
jgi:hypothetical protein